MTPLSYILYLIHPETLMANLKDILIIWRLLSTSAVIPCFEPPSFLAWISVITSWLIFPLHSVPHGLNTKARVISLKPWSARPPLLTALHWLPSLSRQKPTHPPAFSSSLCLPDLCFCHISYSLTSATWLPWYFFEYLSVFHLGPSRGCSIFLKDFSKYMSGKWPHLFQVFVEMRLNFHLV